MLGPRDEHGPVRTVAADALLGAIERASAMGGLEAVRELAQEVEHLDQAGVAGLRARGLGTQHLYKHRLRRGERWQALRELAGSIKKEDWREVLTALGYELERGETAATWLATTAPRLRRAPEAGSGGVRPARRPGPSPRGRAAQRLRGGGHAATGCWWRHRGCDCSRPARGRLGRRAAYLDLDAVEPCAARTGRCWPALAAPISPRGGFATLMQEARDYGAALRERHRPRHPPARCLPVLGRSGPVGGGGGNRPSGRRRAAELERAALTFVFRALFLLYAESAGHLPMSHAPTRKQSLAAHGDRAQDAGDAGDALAARSTALWDDIAGAGRGDADGQSRLGRPAYNGALFAPDGFDGAEMLERGVDPGRRARPGARRARRSTTTRERRASTSPGSRSATSATSTRACCRCGSPSPTATIATTRGATATSPADDDERRRSRAGELLWLTNEGGRKGGGVYYTPRAELVRHLVRRAVVPGVRAPPRRGRERSSATDPAAAAERAVRLPRARPGLRQRALPRRGRRRARRPDRALPRRAPAARRCATSSTTCAPAPGATYGVGIEDVALLERLVLQALRLRRRPLADGRRDREGLALARLVRARPLARLPRPQHPRRQLADRRRARRRGRRRAEEHGTDRRCSATSVDAIARRGEAGGAAARASTTARPDEVERERRPPPSACAQRSRARRALLDLWTAEPLGPRRRPRRALAAAAGDRRRRRARSLADARRRARATTTRVLHWPLAFPEVFARERPASTRWSATRRGRRSRSRSSRSTPATGRPARARREARANEALAELQGRAARAGRAPRRRAGAACRAARVPRRRRRLRRRRRRSRPLQVLLPALPRPAAQRRARSASCCRAARSLAKGSADFRAWLFERATVERLDFLLNSGAGRSTPSRSTPSPCSPPSAAPPERPRLRGRWRR